MADDKAPTVATSTATVVMWLGAGALVVILLLGLSYMAGPDGIGDVLGWVTGLAALLAGGSSAAALSKVRRIEGGVETVRRQTNGVLDERIKNGVAAALAELRKQQGD